MLPVAKSAEDALGQDKRKALLAQVACLKALANPYYADLAEAIELERRRLERALTDHKLLWSIYRRGFKGPVYYTVEEEVANVEAA